MPVEIELKLDKRSLSVLNVISKNKKEFDRGISYALKKSAKMLKDQIAIGMRTDTGRGRTYGTHVASAPGRYPAILTGKYLSSWNTKVFGSSRLEFGSNDLAGKARSLEFGSVRMAARPAGRRSLDKRARDIENVLTRYPVNILNEGYI